MRNLTGIKPQDVLIMMKLVSQPEMVQKELATQLQISQAEISHALQRLKNSHLLSSSGRVIKEACVEFLVHAVKYIFPVQMRSPAVGIPTSFAHPEFKFIKYGSDEVPIWPSAEGKVKGITLLPIYPTLPDACMEDKNLYKLSSLVEMIRAGRTRERNIAEKELAKFIGELYEK
jgi:predicted XRE-type DNA-binding protein